MIRASSIGRGAPARLDAVDDRDRRQAELADDRRVVSTVPGGRRRLGASRRSGGR